ncbi:Protein CONTINUOUS VASCULAR RING 1-like [Dillenia turbinata]|uniref:Protein CONTINUOUS VASCULAR RING 1-like n=1 Tax=Dillenia turbinata TaxID=194707 RepID=A0AAN8V3Q0_9MAGN
MSFWYRFAVSLPSHSTPLGGLGNFTFISFIFLSVFMSSWLGTSVLNIGQWFIRKVPFMSTIYATLKQMSSAISPDIHALVNLQKNSGPKELCCVYVPTSHYYVGDVFLIEPHDVIPPNPSVLRRNSRNSEYSWVWVRSSSNLVNWLSVNLATSSQPSTFAASSSLTRVSNSFSSSSAMDFDIGDESPFFALRASSDSSSTFKSSNLTSTFSLLISFTTNLIKVVADMAHRNEVITVLGERYQDNKT